MSASGLLGEAKVSARPFAGPIKALRNSLRLTFPVLIFGVMVASCDAAPEREGSAANPLTETGRLLTCRSVTTS